MSDKDNKKEHNCIPSWREQVDQDDSIPLSEDEEMSIDIDEKASGSRKRHSLSKERDNNNVSKKIVLSETLTATAAMRKLMKEIKEIKSALNQVTTEKEHQQLIFEEQIRELKNENSQLRKEMLAVSNKSTTNVMEISKKQKSADANMQDLWPNLPTKSNFTNDEGTSQAVVEETNVSKIQNTADKSLHPGKKKTDSKKSPPNLVCYNINQKEVTGSLCTLLGHKNFVCNLVNKNMTHINSFTNDDYNVIKKYLINNKIKFYTYTPNEEKPHSVVIKKLCPSYEENEIMNYITELNLNIEIIKLSKFRNNNWLIQLSRSSNLNEFYNIRYILNCKIELQKLNPSAPAQCKNCQRYTHVASNCFMEYRCVKCAESHGPGNCKIPPMEENNKEFTYTDQITGKIIKTIGLPVKCANCQIQGHTANSRDCPIRNELLQKIQNKKNNQNRNNNNFIRYTSPNVNSHNITNQNTYSSTAKQYLNTPNSAINGGQLFSQINSECSRLFGSGFMPCLQIVALLHYLSYL